MGQRKLAMFLALLALQALTAVPAIDPFAFFQPTVTLTDDDRRQLDRGEPIAHALRADDSEVAVFAAIRVDVDGDRLVAWMRRIEALKKSAYVLAIGRFSDPPAIDDLASLALDDEELSELRGCRRGSCGLKLSAAEMAQVQRAAEEAGGDRNPAIQQAFRRLILERVNAYRAGGLTALPPYENHDDRTWPATSFASVLGHSVFLTERLPRFAEHLGRYPQAATLEEETPEVESFLYWSKERVAGKAIISVTHVNMLRSHDPRLPDALVAGKGIFATHYVNASLGVTAVIRGEPGASNYLVYLNRSDVDMLGGVFGGLVRWIMQRRLKAEAATVLQGLRRRLEGGEPPPVEATVSQ